MAKELPRKLVILTTGGTIEKTYDENEGDLRNRSSVIEKLALHRLRLPFLNIEVKGVMSKDSLVMVDDDRKQIATAINEYSELKCPIVVLHGTDTLDKTVAYLERQSPAKVAVVFTGAMRPLEFENTDALQNLAEAIYAAQIVEPGYYLSFHGRLFKGTNFRKNHLLKTFEVIEKN